MSFSDDLDAARERAGLPVIQRWHCLTCGERLVAVRASRAEYASGVLTRAEAWARWHYAKGHTYELIEGPGRFRIKRFPLRSSTDPVWPWRVTDAERPGVFGRARTHAAAIELVEAMQANPGEHAVIADEDDETVAYVTGKVVRPGIGLVAMTAEPGSILDLRKLDTGAPMRLIINEPEPPTTDPSLVALRRLRERCPSCGSVGQAHRWGCPRA